MKGVWLREDYTRTKSKVTIDTDAGVIRGLKLSGLISLNGRRYLHEAFVEAKALYNGAPAYINHPDKPEKSRDVGDHIGRWVNVRIEEDGPYGDLEYITSHPFASRLVEIAQRMPEQIGCSHNAEGDTEVRDGVVVVTKITEVRSVDIVADPATTNGLFEGKRHVAKTTVKKLLESARKKFSRARKVWVKRLFEDDDMAAPLAAEVDVPAAGEDPMDAAFGSAMHAVVDQYIAGDVEFADALSQFKELAKTHGKLTADAEPSAPTAEDEDDDEEKVTEEEETDDDEEEDEEDDDVEEEEDDEKDVTESRNARLRRLERKDAARDLCEDVGLIPSKDQLTALMEIKSAVARRATAQSFKESNEAKGNAGGGNNRSTGRVRSRNAHSFSEQRRNSDEPKDTKSFVEAIQE